jgi:hypothetical protein
VHARLRCRKILHTFANDQQNLTCSSSSEANKSSSLADMLPQITRRCTLSPDVAHLIHKQSAMIVIPPAAAASVNDETLVNVRATPYALLGMFQLW